MTGRSHLPLNSALHLARPEATGADVRSHRSLIDQDADLLDVGRPRATRCTIGVGYVVSGSRLLLTDDTTPSQTESHPSC